MRTTLLLIAAAALALPVSAASAQEEPLTNPPAEGEAPEAEASPAAGAGTVAAATEADITAGKSVVDKNGEAIGTVESASAAGAVVSTGTGRVQIPLTGFGKNESGLVIGITKTDLEAAAKAQTPQAPSETPPQATPQP